MDEAQKSIFKWESGDRINNLDQYITKNINTNKADYILKLIYNYDKWVEDCSEDADMKELDKYLETYFYLYFVENSWNDFFENFVPKMKDIKMHCPNYLLWIVRVLEDDYLNNFLENIFTKTYSYYFIHSKKPDKASSAVVSNMIFLLSEIITMDEAYIKEYIKISTYKLERPLMNVEVNLLNVLMLLPSYHSENYREDINCVYDTICYMLRKSYYKNNVIDYFVNLTEKFNYRTKSFYIMTYVKDTEANNYLVNLSNILLLLWKGGRKTHPRKINDISMLYIRSDFFDMDSVADEDVFHNSCLDELLDTEELKEKPSFFSQCFFITMKMLYVSLFPLVKVYLKFKKKLDDIQIVTKDIITKWGSYEDIPIIERAVYDKLRNFEKRLIDDKADIEKIFLENTTFMEEIPSFYEDFFNIALRIFDNNKFNEFKSIPEFFLDSALEINLFYYLDCSHSFKITNCLKFIVTILNNEDLINNPYLRFKLIEFLSIKNTILDNLMELPTDKIILLKSLLSNYINLEKFSYNSDIKNKLMVIINYLINNNSDYVFDYFKLSKSSVMKKFIYIMLGTLTTIFDSIVTKFQKIIEIKNSDTADDFKTISYYKDDIQKFSGYIYSIYKNILYSLVSKDIFKVYLKDEILGKLINASNYFVTKLVDKADVLFIDSPKEYFFDKCVLLELSLKIYAIFGKNEKFIDSASLEISFYKPELFLKSIELVKTTSLLTEIDIDTVKISIDKITKKIDELEELMQDVEIPEKFLDPIMQTIINEPVYLPENNIIIDKNIISKHLLNSDKNPFTRSKLTMKMIEEHNSKTDVNLKLEEFKSELNSWKKTIIKK